MGKRPQVLQLDADTIERLGSLLTAVKGINYVKVRTLTVDIGPWYDRHRVRIVGDRSTSSRSVNVTKVERLD